MKSERLAANSNLIINLQIIISKSKLISLLVKIKVKERFYNSMQINLLEHWQKTKRLCCLVSNNKKKEKFKSKKLKYK